ncbi:MAG: precorrin-2 C(20)-methyltransferase [Caldimicrobium sp.]|nr:precorrin-2 C(20)-methyltransferase [Caldimicrobium sp.]MCX7612932.1 precorrin-2 C(20)-methyltransferase [Caldimicrobium sp.]MDW8182101.1 precorrin-2 C(20)-methyltransferase [Caldimicrobium sp.]
MKLYILGIGPGDPELITYKAYNLLKEITLIFYPTGGKEALALSILEKLLDLKDKSLIELYFPMKKERDLLEHWKNLSDKIVYHLRETNLGAFITLGDPAFYSTSYYLKDFLLAQGVEIEVVSGISAFSTASAKFLCPLTLGDEEVIITVGERLVKNQKCYTNLNCIVVFKCHKFMAQIQEFAKKNNFEVFLGNRVSLREERLWRNPQELLNDDLDYFTLAILKRKR